MSKKILIRVPYNTLIEVSPEILGALMSANLYVRESSKAYRVSEDSLEVEFANEEDFGQKAIEKFHENESKKYSKYWSEEREKTQKLENELKELKEKVIKAGLKEAVSEDFN